MQITCPKCGFTKEIPEEKIPPRAQMATCPKCSHRFKFRELVSLEEREKEHNEERETGETQERDLWSELASMEGKKEEAEEEKRYYIGKKEVPWEELEKIGFFNGLFYTIKEVCLSPSKFFKSMPVTGGFMRPLIFYLLISEIYTAFRLIWKPLGFMNFLQGYTSVPVTIGLHGTSTLLLLILYPLFLTTLLFIGTAINHLCLLLVKDGAGGFEGTFRVLCYSSAPMIITVIPLVGPIVGLIWSGVCNFLGFKYAHGTSTAKVVLAMLLPFFFAIALVSILKAISYV